MFEDIGKPNLINLLVFGFVGAVLPKLLPQLRPATGTAIQLVIDLLTESEAEATEDLVEALVSSTIAEIKRQFASADGPTEGRRLAEHSVSRFKHRAQRRARHWASDDKEQHHRYRRHLTKLRDEVARASPRYDGWQRDILDDLGEALDETA
jgi:hypothetical protein